MSKDPYCVTSPPVQVKRVALSSLRGEKEFRKVRQHGVMIRHSLFTVRITDYRPRYGETWQPRSIVGIVVSKKTLKHATKRNRVRRRCREALRTSTRVLRPCRAILYPTAGVLHVPFAQLQAALTECFTTVHQKKRKVKP